MTKIEIDLDLADDVAGRLIRGGGDVRRIMAGLANSIDHLVPDDEVRASVQEILARAAAGADGALKYTLIYNFLVMTGSAARGIL